MKICSKCGTQNDDNAQFCSKCNAPFENGVVNGGYVPNNQAPVSQPPKKKMPAWKIVLIVLACLIGLGIVSSFFSSGDSDSSETTNKETSSTAVSTEKETKSEGFDNFDIKVKSAKITKDYEGKKTLIVTYTFTNNADDPQSFYVTVDDHAYQDGIELNPAFVVEGYNEDNQTKELQKGKSLDVEQAYVLNDNETPVEITIKELISFSDKQMTFTIDLK
ncbi:MAG: hypothetical protein DBY14_03925 [Escherichia coli]|nr:MAG: hypothetical protein DBY14_03925 [Escherichia coli]